MTLSQQGTAEEKRLYNWVVPVLTASVVSPVTFTTAAAAYDVNDVLADAQTLGDVARIDGGTALLQSIMLVDGDDNTAAEMDVVLLSENVSLGTENSAPNISDANAAKILGIVNVPSASWVDVGGAKIVCIRNIGLAVQAATTSKAIYVALITRGTPTQTATGITGRFGFSQD